MNLSRFCPYFLMSGIIILLMLAYEYNHIIKKGPESIHQWRQCDCLAITQMYYQNNNSFFEPELMHIAKNGNGKCSTSEMPIIYFTMAKIWKIFGKNEWIYRGFEALLTFFALLALFHIYRSFIPSLLYPIVMVILFFSSPILAYYGVSFIMDSPALCMSIIGCAFWFKYFWRKQTWHLAASVLFFTVAGLLKISATAAYFAFSFFLITDLFNISKFNLLNENKWKVLLIWSIPIAAWIPWNIFAYNYNSANGNANVFFLTGILPFWDFSIEERWKTYYAFMSFVKMQIYHRSILHLLLFGQILTFFYYKHTHKLIFWLSNLLILILIIYIILFYQVFNVHDYYFVNMMIVPAFIMLNIAITLFNITKTIEFLKPPIAIISLFLVAYNVYYCAGKNYIKFHSPERKPFFHYSYTSSEYAYWSWYHWNYSSSLGLLNSLKTKMPSLGISQDEPIIVMGDGSINISLYLLEKRGFTQFSFAERRNNIDTKTYKHIVFLNPEMLENEIIKPYVDSCIYKEQQVSVYTIKQP